MRLAWSLGFVALPFVVVVKPDALLTHCAVEHRDIKELGKLSAS